MGCDLDVPANTIWTNTPVGRVADIPEYVLDNENSAVVGPQNLRDGVQAAVIRINAVCMNNRSLASAMLDKFVRIESELTGD